MGRVLGTEGFCLNQTMLRIRDPQASLKFYIEVLGMTLMQTLELPELQFSLYFVGYVQPDEIIPTDPAERARFIFDRETTLELTYVWGTDTDPNFKGYHHGNDEPLGFSHIGISVPDVHAACARFEALGIPFRKRPDDGPVPIAFIADPDGYWVEILSSTALTAAVSAAQSSDARG